MLYFMLTTGFPDRVKNCEGGVSKNAWALVSFAHSGHKSHSKTTSIGSQSISFEELP